MRSSLPLLASSRRESAHDSKLYLAYSYSYPHKSAYGPLRPPIPLGPLWQKEDRRGLFLYVHVPFCAMRCGFCNLFTRAGAGTDMIDAYLDALTRQARVVADATAGNRAIARLAVGGGTPTLLSPGRLARLLEIPVRFFGVHPAAIPTSVEVSPGTACEDRLGVLRDFGVRRVSLGVQSFLEPEAHAMGRPQAATEVHRALEALRSFPVLNIDLIYGQVLQTKASWLASIEAALRYRPEEVYLYPLYVRPGTGLGRHDQRRLPDSHVRELYRVGRDRLLQDGYEQVSMRYFRRHAGTEVGPVYCCQTDGMIGLGCGARSYTSHVHYSSRFAVAADAVQTILEDWIGNSDKDFGRAEWGYSLEKDDRCRRFVIQSLLTNAGLSEMAYRAAFGEAPLDRFAILMDLVEEGLAERQGDGWRLTPLGLEFSDRIGPAFYAPHVLESLEAFAHP